jgi:hypothetical protein
MNRADIRTLAEVRSDTDSSDFPTLTQKNFIVDDEARKLWAEMVNNNLPTKRVVVNIAATGAASYPLSVPRLLRIVAVRDARHIAGGNRGTVRRANNLDRNKQNFYSARDIELSELHYDVEMDPATGWTISLYPPNTAGAFEVECLQGHPGFANDTAEWFAPDPSAACIALASAARFLQKEDQDAGRSILAELGQAKGELWQVVQSLAPPQQMEDYVSLAEGWCLD